jgi:hypothetical protein
VVEVGLKLCAPRVLVAPSEDETGCCRGGDEDERDGVSALVVW